MSPAPRIRRRLRRGDLDRITEHHGRLYPFEQGVDSTFEDFVAASIAAARRHGFPTEREAIWLVERDGAHAGSLGVTDEGGGVATLRWVVLDPSLRGRGLGRRLISEAIDHARAVGYSLIRLETFSDLTAAARIYRGLGFEVVDEETGPRWGRDEVTYQRYELDLRFRPEPRDRSRLGLRAPDPV
jgi:ribosomal protein S18 acetylase RimI-like enzyme